MLLTCRVRQCNVGVGELETAAATTSSDRVCGKDTRPPVFESCPTPTSPSTTTTTTCTDDDVAVVAIGRQFGVSLSSCSDKITQQYCATSEVASLCCRSCGGGKKTAPAPTTAIPQVRQSNILHNNGLQHPDLRCLFGIFDRIPAPWVLGPNGPSGPQPKHVSNLDSIMKKLKPGAVYDWDCRTPPRLMSMRCRWS